MSIPELRRSWYARAVWISRSLLSNPLCKLLSNFLNETQVRTIFGNTFGNPVNQRSGVPQGNVISPTLMDNSHIPQPMPNWNKNICSAEDNCKRFSRYHEKNKNTAIRKPNQTHSIISTNASEHHQTAASSNYKQSRTNHWSEQQKDYPRCCTFFRFWIFAYKKQTQHSEE